MKEAQLSLNIKFEDLEVKKGEEAGVGKSGKEEERVKRVGRGGRRSGGR